MPNRVMLSPLYRQYESAFQIISMPTQMRREPHHATNSNELDFDLIYLVLFEEKKRGNVFFISLSKTVFTDKRKEAKTPLDRQ